MTLYMRHAHGRVDQTASSPDDQRPVGATERQWPRGDRRATRHGNLAYQAAGFVDQAYHRSIVARAGTGHEQNAARSRNTTQRSEWQIRERHKPIVLAKAGMTHPASIGP